MSGYDRTILKTKLACSVGSACSFDSAGFFALGFGFNTSIAAHPSLNRDAASTKSVLTPARHGPKIDFKKNGSQT